MKKAFWWGIGTIALFIIIIYFVATSSGSGKYDGLAQCISDSGAKMYGAYWCPHCQEQKKLFGSSWDSVTYVECASSKSNQQTSDCNAAGIKSYPTWIFGDGKQISGVLSLEQLSTFTSCDLPIEE
ncbi:hypothetical protein FJZ21_02235 [Candidatus Pacearchaeota archaeon]|nr:hypothetical protein [Candidatus Pacearchaeota archaeon]